MTTHISAKTKRERIRELILQESTTTTKDIADQLYTTREYVYKERGKLRREGLLVTHQSLAVSGGSHEITVVKGEDPEGYGHVEHDRPTDYVNGDRIYYDIPPVDRSGLMSMYNGFEHNESPGHIIAKYGIHPAISQKEHQRFLVMNLRDPFDLQNKMTSGIVDAPPEIQTIINKSNAGNLLTNDEIMSLVNFKSCKNAESYVKDAILNPTIYLPYGLSRVVCKICHAPQPGVIFDTMTITYAGKATEKLVAKNHVCVACWGFYD